MPQTCCQSRPRTRLPYNFYTFATRPSRSSVAATEDQAVLPSATPKHALRTPLLPSTTNTSLAMSSLHYPPSLYSSCPKNLSFLYSLAHYQGDISRSFTIAVAFFPKIWVRPFSQRNLPSTINIMCHVMYNFLFLLGKKSFVQRGASMYTGTMECSITRRPRIRVCNPINTPTPQVYIVQIPS
jgi:hypothetical protein